jgi:hypothetical protein
MQIMEDADETYLSRCIEAAHFDCQRRVGSYLRYLWLVNCIHLMIMMMFR